MKTLRATNLLGDSLYLLKPIAELGMQFTEDFVVGVGSGFGGDLFRLQFGDTLKIQDMGTLENERDIIDLSAGRAAKIAVQHLVSGHDRPHISECYAEILGVNTAGWKYDFSPLTGWAQGKSSNPISSGFHYAIIAPFSSSCSRHSGMRPNKTPDHERWSLLISWIRSTGIEPIILVGNNEKWTGCNVLEWTATSVRMLTEMLCEAVYVISVDNVVGHIASALRCKSIILWPPVSSVQFIGPTWNKKTKLLYMHPERVRADQLLSIVKKELTK